MSGKSRGQGRWHAAGPTLVAAVVAAALPLFVGTSPYSLDIATVALLFAMFTSSWDFFCGSTGELSFGHSFFVGTAAFGTALLEARLGFSPELAILSGALVGAGAGALIGLLTLRHSGAVFTLVTMAAQLGFHRSLFLWGDLFGGEEGVLIRTPWIQDPMARFATVATLAVGSLGAMAWLRSSALGRQLRAAGGDVRTGLASGVPVARVRTAGAVLSGLVAGLAGSLYAMHHMLANQESAGDTLSGLIFLLAMVGGFGTLLGPWLAAVIYVAFVREALLALGEAEPLVAVGLLFLAIWLAPGGTGHLVHRLSRGWRRKPVEGAG
jgi:branched-chain amino acid transport system permease protein